MHKTIIACLTSAILTACSHSVQISSQCGMDAVIVPDYAGVTLPCNIGPISFSIADIDKAALIIAKGNDTLCIKTDNGTFNIKENVWRSLLQNTDSLLFTICKKDNGKWVAFNTFSIYVSPDSIDTHLVYRKIHPSHGLWGKMSINERNLENNTERQLYDNRAGDGNCINCHSFCNGNPDKWQIHIRKRYSGTYIMDGDNTKRLQLADKSLGNPVYANWHPNGRFIAYSTNSTFFRIHTNHINSKHPNIWEVMDDRSDVMIVDIATGKAIRSQLTASPDKYETFPCFSPDGQWLYFCSANGYEDVTDAYDSVQYNICRIRFDAESMALGPEIDTIYNATDDGGSASFPRISPDGRWLCFTRSEYGNFSICHREADLYLISLQDDSAKAYPLAAANSDETESYHCWSGNSRWLVFSSKRDDAIYTRPYFTHIDAQGNATKPFEMPWLNARHYYDLQMNAYNIPEFTNGEVRTFNIAKMKETGK